MAQKTLLNNCEMLIFLKIKKNGHLTLYLVGPKPLTGAKQGFFNNVCTVFQINSTPLSYLFHEADIIVFQLPRR